MNSIQGRVAVVTGAAGLIGNDICLSLVAEGWRVVAVDRALALVDGVDAYCVDVTDPVAMSEVASQVADNYGHIDGLIHAAALTGRTLGHDVGGQLVTLDLRVWHELIEANLTGALVCVREFLPQLRLSDAPKVLMIGSIQGLVPTIGGGAYSVSKAALVGLTRQLAAELAAHGVTVNMLAPGPISDADELERLGAQNSTGVTPMGRFGSPQEVARAVCHLMDGSFGYMTGVIIPFDGGEHLRPRYGPRRAGTWTK